LDKGGSRGGQKKGSKKRFVFPGVLSKDKPLEGWKGKGVEKENPSISQSSSVDEKAKKRGALPGIRC